MRANASLIALAGALLLAASAVHADRVVLRSGKTVEGTFRGASATTLHIETASGLRRLAIADVVAVRFDRRSAQEQRDVHARTTRAVIVGAGAELPVELPESVRSGKLNAGDAFIGKLAADLDAGPVVAAPAGTPVHGEIVSVAHGRMQLALSGIELDGDLIPIRLRTYTLDLAHRGSGPVRFQVREPFAVRVAGQ